MLKKDVDIDPTETKEWIQSIESVIKKDGFKRAKYIIRKISKEVYKFFEESYDRQLLNKESYINTIPVEEEPEYPGDLKIEKTIRSFVRWNALMMVLKASKKNLDLGGHISSFQSSATIYEVCFNHFFKARNKKNEGDLVYFQGHISPGIYSRAFLEGRLTENQIENFRQEISENGLPSYPHPKLMPYFWQFPTVSMGLSAISSIYQAKFLKYLQNRGLQETNHRKVYVFLGDGEMDEPEAKGAINIASREKLDNIIFIVNCNLQRLDGPVYGNGKIINELENIFLGSGWEVIKVLWGCKWDSLIKRDSSGKLKKLMYETLDGDYQNLRSKDGKYIRKHFFERYSETRNLVKNMTDNEIWDLNYGGHDPRKIYAAFEKARKIKNKPTVILFQTIKGYGLGKIAESKNIAHQVKVLNIDSIMYFRDKFKIPLDNKEIKNLPFLKFEKGSKEYNYLHHRRSVLGGYIPFRREYCSEKIAIPKLEEFKSILTEQERNISTTTAFLRIFRIMLRNKNINQRLVPIIADEARTFGIDGLFRQIGIYNSDGQKYTPQDLEQILYYKEEKDGQILQEGINELGAGSSWLAASTSYSTNNLITIPFYIYYSIFGFQRIGDLLWAAGDQQAKGFLIGATSGRTTLNGEGLQHEDGHSHIQSLTVPNCISYNPSYAYELAVIIQNGLERMYGKKQENIYYYITIVNENYRMPSIPHNSVKGILKGIYKLESNIGEKNTIQILGSGSMVRHACKAGKILMEEYKINTIIYSVTSFTELARDGQDCERWNMLHPKETQKVPYITKIIKKIPTVAVTDYMKLFAEQIRSYIPTRHYHVLGTDGFGKSDSRENLRYHFEINVNFIVIAGLYLLKKSKKISKILLNSAIKKYKIDPEKINPRL
ncbi:pyruvate dehydrogenase [Candidatus Riesia sp. GBBU]|nr:pyruvate dehydrogenase [Candidatus Riesia sp. GBBU]